MVTSSAAATLLPATQQAVALARARARARGCMLLRRASGRARSLLVVLASGQP